MSGKFIQAAGGVVYCHDPAGSLLVLLIRDRYGVWTLPKGHLEAGESESEAALREIDEETGLTCQLEGLIQRVEYPVFKRGTWHDKQVAYFVARAEYLPPVPRLEEGIAEACWLPPDEAIRLICYAQVRDVVRRALARIGAR